MNYQDLVSHIDLTHGKLQVYAANVVNQSLTIRNWLIGFYIIEYEQNGSEKAKYGDNIIDKLATSLKHINGIDARSLRRFRQFYLTYHYFQIEIWGTVTPILKTEKYLSPKVIFFQILGPKTQNSTTPILGSLTQKLEQYGNHSNSKYYKELFSKISYTHFIELIKIDDPLKRKFYTLSGMEEKLFVSQYMIHLPDKEKLKSFIEQEIKNL